jgi:uncharacterized protein YcbK (DUF882 family)
MGDISAHFNRSEFACQCGCGFDTVDIELSEALEVVRQYFMAPVTITSGCRCAEHNQKIGGSPKSKHVEGRAADFKVQGHAPQEVHDFLTRVYKDKFGIGLYRSWVHLDTRSGDKARWQK